MKFTNLIGLIGFNQNNWTINFFIYPNYWQWGYKHIKPDIFPYWESKSFSLGPLFMFYILLTDMNEWFKLKK